ncbi:MAG: hypothetical protein R3F11_03670 [Verrucomicrobiales bacterium]
MFLAADLHFDRNADDLQPTTAFARPRFEVSLFAAFAAAALAAR